jgi:hypothetical protein
MTRISRLVAVMLCLSAPMAFADNQPKMKEALDALKNAKGELAARVAEIEADLKVLRLAETKSSAPSGSNTRLDDIKATLSDFRRLGLVLDVYGDATAPTG